MSSCLPEKKPRIPTTLQCHASIQCIWLHELKIHLHGLLDGYLLGWKITRRSTFHIWWKHRPRLGFTTFHLIQIMPVSGWSPKHLRLRRPKCDQISFQNWCLDFESYLYNVYIIYIIMYVTYIHNIHLIYTYLNDKSLTKHNKHIFNHATPVIWAAIEVRTPWRPACSSSAAWKGESWAHWRNIAGPLQMDLPRWMTDFGGPWNAAALLMELWLLKVYARFAFCKRSLGLSGTECQLF